MPTTLRSRLRTAWNAFTNKDPTEEYGKPYSSEEVGTVSSYYRPDRPRFTRGNERSIVTSVLNRIAMDVSALKINHVQLDENGRFEEVIDSSLNNCLTLDANIDQTGRAFMQDVVISMLDEGSVAIIPVDTTNNPITGSYKINTLRTGKIVEWRPKTVRVRAYNENTGNREEITLPKSVVAIVENPLYAVMNEPNSTYQRLVRKLALLDVVDSQNSSGKLDMIIQLPYTIRSEKKMELAEDRRKKIEDQLVGSKYGIAYVDATEKITQLNRPLDNNLLTQIEYLTNQFYSQLGISQAVMDGTADEKTMLNYNNRVIEPIISAIADEMKRKFLTKTARTQGQSIQFFRDPFKLVPVEQIAEIADKFTRNEITSSNEMRQAIGMQPSKDPKADELRNANISEPNQETEQQAEAQVEEEQEEEIQNGV